MKNPIENSRAIDTMPTKELFIDMLTRDIVLAPAIADLVDNCADGAKRLRGEKSFKNLWVRIVLNKNEFRIADNCGGIGITTARDYAFRFGRASGAPNLKHSVGQFGVGMKRAIFKMGRVFEIESRSSEGKFLVQVDVDTWAADSKWQFQFKSLEAVNIPEDGRGTTIHVTKLKPDVAEAFGLRNFETELKNLLQSRLQDPVARGLTITLNQIPIEAEPLQMLVHRNLAPAFVELKYPAPGEKPVVVKLYCGIGNSDRPEAAGWHVFCNGRLILEADKTDITGWDYREASLSIPGFHGQYNHLRGYAYFDCDDGGRLPWNTTKTGVNTDSTIYRAVRLEMMRLMRPVVDFCNRLKEEKVAAENGQKQGPLEKLVSEAKPKGIELVSRQAVFEWPSTKPPTPIAKHKTRISYERSVTKFNQVKAAIKATTAKEVGELTFDYYYEAEVNNE